MKLIEFEPQEKRYRKGFIEFPFKLYANTPQWVPPLRIDMKNIFNTQKHAFYQSGKAHFILAFDDSGQTIGRLAVMENQRYNAYFKTKTAFFYLFEAIDDFSVVKALFDSGFNWAVNHGLTKIVGPKGFSVMDGFGTLIKGFEYRPAFGQIYNPPYYPTMLEQLGFEKKWDAYTGYMDRASKIPDKIFQVAELVQKKRNFKVLEFKSKAELRSFVPDLRTLYNKSLADDSRNMPLSGADMQTMVNQFIKFADPKLIKLIYKNDKAIGFLLAFPDISKALQRCKGRLFPLGWIDLLRELKQTKCINFNGAGLLEEHRRIGGTALLYAEIYKSVISSKNYTYGEMLQVRDNNPNMMLEWESLGIELRKIHRFYQRKL